MPWKCIYFKDKNVEKKIISVIYQDKSKQMNMIEKLFSVSLFYYVREAISQRIPTHQMEDNSLFIFAENKKGWSPLCSWKGFRLAAQLPRAISRLLCSRTGTFDDYFWLQAKLGFIIHWVIFQTFAN